MIVFLRGGLALGAPRAKALRLSRAKALRLPRAKDPRPKVITIRIRNGFSGRRPRHI